MNRLAALALALPVAAAAQVPPPIVIPRDVVVESRKCIDFLAKVIAREREIGRESGFVNAAIIYEATRHKQQCQRELDEATRVKPKPAPRRNDTAQPRRLPDGER